MASGRTKGKGGAVLVRRKAALERAAARVAERRRVAAAAEAERLRREAAFDEWVADFELAVEDEAAVVAEVEEEVARVRERGRVRIEAARVVAARVVLAMGEAGETVAGCGQRLGVGVERVKELRRLGREVMAAEDSASGSAPGKGNAAAPAKAAASGKAAALGEASLQETVGGLGGEQGRDGGWERAGAVSRGAGAVPVAAPPVTAPAAPPAAGSVPPAAPPGAPGAPAGSSGAPGGGGAGSGWPESSR
ncbi:hypothetical protein ACFQ9Z_38695 [Streptomyces sp. NPDC056580]|uniref:hypothetical protein n=1 Tax=Streptomyces sp. NPDC056580 TaxID=3345872 RepID=UPI003696BC84